MKYMLIVSTLMHSCVLVIKCGLVWTGSESSQCRTVLLRLAAVLKTVLNTQSYLWMGGDWIYLRPLPHIEHMAVLET